MPSRLYALVLFALVMGAHAQEDDAVLNQMDTKIKQGRDWLRDNKEDPDWSRRDTETWKVEQTRMQYLKCKSNPEGCSGS